MNSFIPVGSPLSADEGRFRYRPIRVATITITEDEVMRHFGIPESEWDEQRVRYQPIAAWERERGRLLTPGDACPGP